MNITEYLHRERPEMTGDTLWPELGDEQWETVKHLYDWISPSNIWQKKKGYRYYQALKAGK